MPSMGVVSGDWRNAIIEDFANGTTPFGMLTGWVAAAGANGSNAQAAAAAQALCKFSGAVVQTTTSTTTGNAALELTSMVLNNANGLGVDADCLMAVDTALPSATQNAAWLFGVFDSAGAVTTGNFIGIMYGFNPVTNAANNGFMLCADTVARLTGNTPTAQAVSLPLTVAPALDVPATLRFDINTAWTLVKGAVNGVPAFPAIGTSSQLNIYPNLLVPANGIPNITQGWLGIKIIPIVGTAQTMKILVDLISYSLPGRVQFS